METRNELLAYLKHFERRIRLYDGWLLLQRTVWLAALCAALILLAGRIWPIEGWALWSLIPFAVWLLGIAGYSLFRPLSSMRTACRVDAHLGLKERLSSSLELSSLSGQQNRASAAYQGQLVTQLHQNALEIVQTIQPHRAFPLLWLKKPLYRGAAFLTACLLLAFLPNPMPAVLADRRAVEIEARHQAEKIEELQKEIEQSQNLSEEDKEELLRQLAELARQLRENSGSREEALANLSRVEEQLSQRLDANSAAQQAALEALAARLQELAGMDAAASEDDLAAAAEALDQLSELAQSGDETQRQSLADNLAELSARASQSGNSSLAQALAAMADAVRSGSQSKASQAASAAQKALSQAKNNQARQAALQNTLAQLQNSRQSLCKNSGTGKGQGQGTQQGQIAGSGGGSKADVLPPSSGGSIKAQSPRGNKPVSQADLLNQSIFAPRQTGKNSGKEMQISGQDTGQGQEEIKESPNPLPGQNNPSVVPYQEVYQQYMNAANQAMEQSYVPAHLKDYVRSYFSQLEP